MTRRGGKVVRRRLADENHAVATVVGQGSYRRTPCVECPWRTENDGVFPAEAFRISARTAYDAAWETFGCHMSSCNAPMTCAGFILASHHNLSLRLKEATGKLDRDSVHDDGVELHDSYRAMAVANGVDPDDPVLTPCR